MTAEDTDDQESLRGQRPTAASTLRLVRWWLIAVLLAWYPVRNIPLEFAIPVVAVMAAAAAALVVQLSRRPPQDTAGKVVAYACAVVANQGADVFYGFASMLPGSVIEALIPTPWSIAYAAARALLALWTFQIVRSWLSKDSREVQQRNRTRLIRLISGTAAAGAALVVMFAANVIYGYLSALVGTPDLTVPIAPGGTDAFLILTVTLGLAGVVEEPVFIGIAALLWPREQPNAFVTAAVISSLARSTIHMYYAVGAGSQTGAAVFLLILWCALWSSFNLYLVYRTGRLWPVMVAHGVQNMAVAAAGPFVITNVLLANLVGIGILAVYLLIIVGTVAYLVVRIRQWMENRPGTGAP